MLSYDKKALLFYLSILVGVLLAMYFSAGYGFAIVIPIVVVSLLRGKLEDLLFFLTLVGTIVVGNNNLMPKNTTVFIMQRSLLALFACVMALKIFNGRCPSLLKPFALLAVYLGFMMLPSALGWCPLVSYLKLLLFTGCLFAYWGTVANVVRNPRVRIEKLRSVFLAFAVFFILGSICLIPFPSISQLEAEKYMEMVLSGRHVTSLFTGMTNMSQCLGPIVATIACVLFGDLVFGVRRPDKLYILLLLCCPILIYKTSSRTALGTFCVGMISVLYCLVKTRIVDSKWKSRVVTSCVGVGVAGLVAVMCSTGIRQGALNFLMKWSSDDVQVADVSYGSVYMTRQGKMEEGWMHFKQSPLIGNGFQVSEDMVGVKANSVKDVLSAPVEKGVWVTAILEEGGVVGMGLFLLFAGITLYRLQSLGAYTSGCLLVTFIVANLGEFMLFSMSYIGGFMWAMQFLAIAIDGSRIRQERELQYCNF